MRMLTLKAAAACLGLVAVGFSSIAGAQGISISPANSTVNTGGGATTPSGINVVFTAGGTPPVSGYQTDIDFNNAQMSVSLALGNAASCVLFDPNTVRVLDFDAGGNPLPTGTACTLTFTVLPGQTGGTVYPLNVTATSCSDAGGNPVVCTETDGTITVVATSSPTVTSTPPSGGTITFPAGTSGTTANQSVTFDGTGGTAGESTTVENCVVTGAGLSLVGFAPFTINSGDPAGDVDGTVTVQCAYLAATPRNGTLTCDVNPTLGATTQSTYTVTCPAGGATPPTVAYTPAPPGPIVFTGTGGAVVSRTVTVTQTATGQAGTSVTVQNCATTAGFTAPVLSPNPIVINGGTSGQSGTITTSCTIPATAPNTTGTLTCDEVTNNGVASSTVVRTWNLVCQAPAPEFNSTPPPGSTVTLTGAPSTTVNGSINVQNQGLAPLTVTGCTITGTGAASFTAPVAPGPIAPGGNGNITFACTAPSAAGTTATAVLSCTTNDSDETTVTWNLACTSLVLSIPTVGMAGKSLMVLLVLTLGLIGFGVHRRMA